MSSFRVVEDGHVTTPRGFRAGAVYAGLKVPGPGKLDVALLVSDTPGVAAGIFTQSTVKAAPVLISQEHLAADAAIRGFVVNAGNANACTGEEGRTNARQMAALAAERFGGGSESFLVASTGVIGHQLPMDKVRNGITAIDLSPENGPLFTRAIMTTDTRPKAAAVELAIDGRTVRIGGAAKGAGMIHPDMATLLVFVTTDAALDAAFAREAIRLAGDESFNLVTVDGDTSTNDSLFLLANGRAGNAPLTAGSPAAAAFQAALNHVCRTLAIAVAADGEGATKLIEVTVSGARSLSDARRCAKSIAGSMLLKSAVYGNDPNWGRIMMAAGKSGCDLIESKVDVAIGKVDLFRQGTPLTFDVEAAAAALAGPTVSVFVNLNLGEFSATGWGCDLTEEYVHINADYTT